jgi:hypothetical protein
MSAAARLCGPMPASTPLRHDIDARLVRPELDADLSVHR